MASGARGHKTKSISIVTLFFFHPFVFTLSNFSCQIGYSSRITHTSKITQKARQNTRNKPNTRVVLGIRNLVSAVCFCGYNICPHTWRTYLGPRQLMYGDIQLFRGRLSEKVNATIPKGIVGGFEFTVLQRNLKKWYERPWTMFESAKGKQQS